MLAINIISNILCVILSHEFSTICLNFRKNKFSNIFLFPFNTIQQLWNFSAFFFFSLRPKYIQNNAKTIFVITFQYQLIQYRSSFDCVSIFLAVSYDFLHQIKIHQLLIVVQCMKEFLDKISLFKLYLITKSFKFTSLLFFLHFVCLSSSFSFFSLFWGIFWNRI